ncbi:hypothetical protein RCL1_007551 [Eukaryota sp. TZLM3-RCL]
MQCSVTKFTPFELLFGTNTTPRRSLIDYLDTLNTPVERTSKLKNHTEAIQHLEALADILKRKWTIAVSNQNKNIKEVRNPKFQIGDAVLRLSQNRTDKLHGNEGPFEVIKVLGSNGYKVRNLNTPQEFDVAENDLVLWKPNSLDSHAKALAATDTGEFVVESIVDHCMIDDHLWFLVKFAKGTTLWQPIENLKDRSRTNESLLQYSKEKKLKLPSTRKTKKK